MQQAFTGGMCAGETCMVPPRGLGKDWHWWHGDSSSVTLGREKTHVAVDNSVEVGQEHPYLVASVLP